MIAVINVTNNINANGDSCTHTITLPPDHFDLRMHISVKLGTICHLFLRSTAAAN